MKNYTWVTRFESQFTSISTSSIPLPPSSSSSTLTNSSTNPLPITNDDKSRSTIIALSTSLAGLFVIACVVAIVLYLRKTKNKSVSRPGTF